MNIEQNCPEKRNSLSILKLKLSSFYYVESILSRCKGFNCEKADHCFFYHVRSMTIHHCSWYQWYDYSYYFSISSLTANYKVTKNTPELGTLETNSVARARGLSQAVSFCSLYPIFDSRNVVACVDYMVSHIL